jgi:asparagine synthase (glutamine-hydrolysing)
MIMAWQKPSAESLPCYTFGDGTGIRQPRDVIVAQRVARACKQSHEVIPVGEEFLSRFSHYAERTVYLTDGCLDLMHSPDLYLNEKARAIAPVRMTGNYGSEVLRHAVAFKPWLPTEGLFNPGVLKHIRAAEETYAGLLRGNPVSFAVFRQAPWHHYGLLALEQTQLSLRTPYLDNDLVRTVFRAPESALLNNDACLRLIADGDTALAQILTDRGLHGNGERLSTSAYRSFLEFTFRAEYAYDSGMPHWVARIDHLLSPLRLERLFLGRHKFHHFRVWYRDALSGYVRDMLLDPRSLSRSYLEPHRLKAVVEGHIKGNRNYTFEIHKMLTLELFHRVFIDAK